MRWCDTPTAQRIAAVTLGATSVAAFAPLGLFPLLWLTLAGLFRLLDRPAGKRTVRTGALLGFLFGIGFFLAGVSWVYVSLSTFGGMPMPLAALATLLFCAAMALYPALAGALYVRFAPSTAWRRAVFFAALWTLAEWLRGWFLTGFPWLAIGYAHTPPSPLAGYAPILGVYGVSLATALTAAASGLCMTRGLHRPGLALLAAPLALGALLQNFAWTHAQGEPLRVALLQGNIPQDIKWQPETFVESLRTYYRLMRDHPAQLTVLPETALPVFLHELPADYLDAMQQLAAREQGDLLFGTVTGNRSGYTNSAVSHGASGMQRYDKSHLVPFGEFIPPGFAWFMAMAHIPMSDFTPGATTQNPLQLGGRHIAVNICYEDAFGEEIARALPEAELLVNLSNVAWFGDSLAPAQHLQIARMRALETGRPMLRATNTGMTAIVGPDGRVVSALPPFTRAALTGEIRAYTGLTPYARWRNWPLILICLVVITFPGQRQRLS